MTLSEENINFAWHAFASCISADWEATGWVRENEPEITVDSRVTESAVFSCEVRQITGWAALGAPHSADSRMKKVIFHHLKCWCGIPETLWLVQGGWERTGKVQEWATEMIRVLQHAASEKRGSGAGI